MPTTGLGTVLNHLRHSLLRRGEAPLTDGELLEGYVARRDEAAFEALLLRHGPMVLGVCRRVLRSEADVEDAFQATFLVLVRKAASIRPRGMVGNWLYGVAHTTALKARTMTTKRSAKEREAAARRRPRAEAPTEERLYALLDQELRVLPDKYRAAIVLCDLEGKTIKEAARQLGCPPGTAGTRLARGRALLSRRLSRRGLALSGALIATAVAPNAASAGVPASLLISTTKAAGLFAAGHAVSGVVGAKAAALTEGALKAMLLTKLKLAAVILMAAAAVSLGAVGAAGSRPAEESGGRNAKVAGQVLPAHAAPADDKPKAVPDVTTTKGTVNGVLESVDTDPQSWSVTVTLPEIRGINRKGGIDTIKAVHIQDLPVWRRVKVWINDKEGAFSDLKKNMSVTLHLAVQDGIWVEEIDAAD